MFLALPRDGCLGDSLSLCGNEMTVDRIPFGCLLFPKALLLISALPVLAFFFVMRVKEQLWPVGILIRSQLWKWKSGEICPARQAPEVPTAPLLHGLTRRPQDLGVAETVLFVSVVHSGLGFSRRDAPEDGGTG